MKHTFFMLGTTVFSPLAESIVLYATGPIKDMPVTMDGAHVEMVDTTGDDEFGHRFNVVVPAGAVSVTTGPAAIAFKSSERRGNA